MIQVLINGQQADLLDGNFELTKQVADISSLTFSKSSRSSSIYLAPTALNYRLLDISEGSNNPKTTLRDKIRVDIISDGTYLMAAGRLIVQEYDEEGIRCEAYQGAIDLYSVLGDAQLRELDLFTLEHKRNSDNIYISRQATENYIYAVVDNGLLDPDSNALLTQYLLPCVYISTLMKKIIERAGFSLEGGVLSDQQYKDSAIALTSLNACATNNSEVAVSASQVTPQSVVTGDAVVSKLIGTQTDTDLVGTDFLGLFQSTADAILTNSPCYAYIVPEDGFYDFTCEATIEATGLGVPSFLSTFRMMAFLSGFGRSFLPDVKNIANGEAVYTVTNNGGYFLKGTAVFAYAVVAVGTGKTLQIKQARFRCTAANISRTPYGATYGIDENLPEMKQSDFIKAVCATFQQIPIVDADNGTVTLFNYDDAYKNIKNNLTGKVNMAEPKTRQLRISGYSKSNELKYANADPLDETYGNGYINVDDDSLEDRGVIVENGFSLSEQRFNYLNYNAPVCAYLPCFDENGDFTEPVDGVRLVIIKRFSSGTTVEYTDDTGVTLSQSDNVVAYCHFNQSGYYSLWYGNDTNTTGLITKYFKGLTAILEASEVLTVKMLLSENDYGDIDFLKALYLEEFKANFIINKISGYLPRKNCTVELIKM